MLLDVEFLTFLKLQFYGQVGGFDHPAEKYKEIAVWYSICFSPKAVLSECW